MDKIVALRDIKFTGKPDDSKLTVSNIQEAYYVSSNYQEAEPLQPVNKHVCDEQCMKDKEEESAKYEGKYKFRDTKGILSNSVKRNKNKAERQNKRKGRRQ